MSLSCQCLRDTYCQLGEILSAHFDGVQKIMSSSEISPVKKKKIIKKRERKPSRTAARKSMNQISLFKKIVLTLDMEMQTLLSGTDAPFMILPFNYIIKLFKNHLFFKDFFLYLQKK